eukprot:GHVS01073988.1.p1 GENE.GHVS01073988.1~~GHVS01073988.1.p1  ORF type:complete len:648 (-),score=66.41 GHVS01073988.1:446-2221(-)
MEAKKQDEATEVEEGGDKISASERRRLRRLQQAAEKKSAKEAAKEASPKANGEPKKKTVAEEEESMTPQQYFMSRVSVLEEAERRGQNPYPHKFSVTMTTADFVNKYQHLGEGEHKEDEAVCVAGRIIRLASSGQKLRFYDLRENGTKIQVMANFSHHDKDSAGVEFAELHDSIRRGDNVGIRGFPGKSKRGELSIFPREVKVLSSCLRMLPPRTIKDYEIRYRQRYLDLIINEDNRKTFLIRNQCIRYIRQFLEDRDFIEVETPMMHAIPGGAAARPFVTYHNELDEKLYMRIAPELYLKKLIVGGLDRVFEIGKNFRNEGIDLTHNPEFTSCEFYWAFRDYNDLMKETEDMVSGLVKSLKGSYNLSYHPHGPDGEEVTVDFTPPFPRISMIEAIEKASTVTLPRPLDSSECAEVMKSILLKHHVEMPHPPTPAKLLDQLCGHFVESTVISRPTFIIDHPQIMSPLAKWHRTKPEMTERFELFVVGKEICNAYTELNDPRKQRECFQQQAKAITAGDDEACPIDEGFCTALEYGLPPTAGWGLGIDRLTMFLADKNNIKEVILFPAMRTIQPVQSGQHVEAPATTTQANS